MPAGRILVTGASGFAGRHVAARLLRERRMLTLAVRNPLALPAAWSDDPLVRVVETKGVDVAAEHKEALADVSAVVHLAGLAHVAASDGKESDDLFMRSNADLTASLASAASASGVECFIHLSSLAAFTPNAASATIDDSTDFPPSTAYGRSKRAAEKHVRDLVRAGVFAVSLRPPLIVGHDAKGNWASLQALAATGLPLPFASLANKRSFIGIETLAEAVSLLCGAAWPRDASGEYCLADPDSLSPPEIISELRAGMGMPPRLFHCPPAVFDALGRITGRSRQLGGLTGELRVDASRFYTTFGFRPSRPLRQAVRRSGEAYAAARRG